MERAPHGSPKVEAKAGKPGMKLPQCIPILTSFTERVAACEMTQLLRSPETLARALADTQTVVGHDGVLCLFYPSLLASACIRESGETPDSGASRGGRLKRLGEIPQSQPAATLLESIEPLRHHLRGRALVYATFAGPGLLYSQLQEALGTQGETDAIDPDFLVDVTRSMTRAALELKADGVALIEQMAPAIRGELPRAYKMVRKLADFYDAGFLLFRLCRQEDPDEMLQAHCIFDLAAAENGMQPVSGKPGSATTWNVAPVTTAGDIPGTTTVEELKTLLQKH
jgi:hypothetical protein